MIHSGASVSSFGSLQESMLVNVNGTHNAMLAAKKAGVLKAIHIGTEASSVNAKGDPLIMLTEETPLPDKPFNTIYTTTKNLAEKAALSYNEFGKFEVVCVRPRFIWGVDDTVILPQLVDAANKGIYIINI